MDTLVAELVTFAEAHATELAALRPHAQIDLLCGIFAADAQGGFELSPALMRRMAALELVVGFDIYGAYP